jgi:hypothetical protein
MWVWSEIHSPMSSCLEQTSASPSEEDGFSRRRDLVELIAKLPLNFLDDVVKAKRRPEYVKCDYASASHGCYCPTM